MASALTVVIPRPGQAPLVFPPRCAGCGAASDAESTLVVTRFVVNKSTGEQEPATFSCHVPHCERCARATKVTFLAQLIPFLLGFLVFGVTAFVAAWAASAGTGLDEVGNPERMNSLVVAAAAALAGGLTGGVAVELAARALLVPLLGRVLLRAPLLVATMFSDADHVAGVRARPNLDATEVTLTFDRDDLAAEFASANALRLVRR